MTFTFLGFEAGYDNDFNLNGTELFSTENFSSNTVTGISDSKTVSLTAGMINYLLKKRLRMAQNLTEKRSFKRIPLPLTLQLKVT